MSKSIFHSDVENYKFTQNNKTICVYLSPVVPKCSPGSFP
jgi:hypothetical protein